MLLLQGIEHCRSKEVGDGVAAVGNRSLHIGRAELHPFTAKSLTADSLSFYMVSGIILLESSLLAGKKAEAVIGLTGPWRLGRVKNQ